MEGLDGLSWRRKGHWGEWDVHGLALYLPFAAADFSLLAKIGSLLVLPFAHEDLAIILGGYIITNKLLPVSVVALSLYCGMVVSDFALYGLGMMARRLPWLRRFAVDSRVLRFGDMLKRNLFAVVAFCRVVPGVVFFAFVACGWTRVSPWRFAAASLIVSALYLPLMLYLVIVFGDALDDRVGLWAWPMLLAAMAATGFARKRVFRLQGADEVAAETAPDTTPRNVCVGMPALATHERRVAAAERIPPALFYIPLVLNWLRLGLRYRSLTLPSAVNPAILTGGMWGETKSSYFNDISPGHRRWVADFVTLERGADPQADLAYAQDLLVQSGLAYPLIAKPDVGWHGHGVRCLNGVDDLAAYLAQFPCGASLLLQRYVDDPAEAAVLYARLPGEARGRILSLTLRYFPHVVGDGVTALRDLIRRDERAGWKAGFHLGIDRSHCSLGEYDLARVPASGEVVRIALIGNQRAGALYRDGSRYISAALETRLDAIARSMMEFHYGRFDIRFKTVEALMQGEDFSIVEINGIGGESIDVWDPGVPVRDVYRRLADQQRLLFLIGARNRERGFRPTGVTTFVASLMRQTRLIRRYPASA